MIREIVARGATLPEAFGEAALALFALAADRATVRDREIREIRAHGVDLESLLTHWIGECCYVREIEGFSCCAIEFPVFEVWTTTGGEPMRLHALLRGEVDPNGTADLELSSRRAVRICHLGETHEITFTIEMGCRLKETE